MRFTSSPRLIGVVALAAGHLSKLAGRDEVLSAMRGHVITSGELVATNQQTVEPPK